MNEQFYEGQRVRLTCDLPDDALRTPDLSLYCGETGIIAQIPNQPETIGFQSDRFGKDIIFISRTVEGKERYIIDFCVPINSQLAETQKLPEYKEGQDA